MKTIKETLLEAIKKSLEAYGDVNVKIEVDYSNGRGFGDYSTNVAMPLGKFLNKPPLELAEAISDNLRKQPDIIEIFEKIEYIKPGFINFYLSKGCLIKKAEEILKRKKDFGELKAQKKEKIQIEFISANPTGPLTIGNGRGGFYGDVLANVLEKCGHKVIREYLVNDAGNQIKVLGHSVLKDDQAIYKGDYIDKLNLKYREGGEPEEVGKKAAEFILENLIKRTVKDRMKIDFDIWFSEDKQLRRTDKIGKVLDWLKEKDLVYEKENAWWFKSSNYGDARDRVLIKTGGEYTYLAQDFAYLENKLKKRKFDKVINVWGADHHGDVPALLNAAEVLGFKGKQEIILLQFVRLYKDGKEVRMSKRTGTYITMKELIEMVGHDSARFSFLMYSSNSHIDFDINKAKDKSDTNPVYYVQYAYARMSGILRQQNINIKLIKNELNISDDCEFDLIKEILKWPEILIDVCTDYQVQKIISYATSLSDKFHQFYSKCRVIDDGKINYSRVALVKLSRKILKEVLEVISISSPEKM